MDPQDGSITNPLRSLPPLKSFPLTHILYSPSDPFSIPFTLLSLSPIFLFVSYFTLLIFTRRITILILAIGSILNEILSLHLKSQWKGDRPFLGHGEIGEGWGMPSSHSQCTGFLVAWGIEYSLSRSKRESMGNEKRSEGVKGVQGVRKVVNGIYLFGLVLWSILTSYSRYHLLYHTPFQVITGYIIGVIAGSIYFVITVHIPLHHPESIFGIVRSKVEWVWEGLGGIGGWDLGAAPGGWGEGWVFLPRSSDESKRKQG